MYGIRGDGGYSWETWTGPGGVVARAPSAAGDPSVGFTVNWDDRVERIHVVYRDINGHISHLTWDTARGYHYEPLTGPGAAGFGGYGVGDTTFAISIQNQEQNQGPSVDQPVGCGDQCGGPCSGSCDNGPAVGPCDFGCGYHHFGFHHFWHEGCGFGCGGGGGQFKGVGEMTTSRKCELCNGKLTSAEFCVCAT